MDTLPTYEQLCAELYTNFAEDDPYILQIYGHLYHLHHLSKDDDSKFATFIKNDIIPFGVKAVCDHLQAKQVGKKIDYHRSHGHGNTAEQVATRLKYILTKSEFALRDFVKFWD